MRAGWVVCSNAAMTSCSLCDHEWSFHHGSGQMALWVTCTFGSVECYCRRTVEEAHAELGGPPGPMCVTTGQCPAEDTQCRACREDRQRRARNEFAVWWERMSRGGRGAGGRTGRWWAP